MELSLSSSRRRPRSPARPASSIFAATVGARFHLLAWEMRRAEQHRKAALKLEPTGTSLGCSRRGSQSWRPTLSKTFRARQKR